MVTQVIIITAVMILFICKLPFVLTGRYIFCPKRFQSGGRGKQHLREAKNIEKEVYRQTIVINIVCKNLKGLVNPQKSDFLELQNAPNMQPMTI